MGRLIIGCNQSHFDALRAEAPAVRGRRQYCALGEIPSSWPRHGDAVTCLSLRPDPAELFAGRLNTALRNLIDTAPPGSWLNCYHEAGNLADYHVPPFDQWVTPSTIRQIHTYVHNLCRGSQVRYCPILCMPATRQHEWMPAGLDGYALDVYDWPQFHLFGWTWLPFCASRVRRHLDDWKAAVTALTGDKAPVLLICETNSPDPDDRPRWFRVVGDWLLANGGQMMLVFWRDGGPDSGPFLPADIDTFDVLQSLAEA